MSNQQLTTFSINVLNDLYLDKFGNIALSNNIEALSQICKEAAQVRLGELVLNINEGIPYFQVVFNGTPSIPQFEAALRSTFLNIPGVISVVSLGATTGTGKTAHTLFYTAVLQTTYGTEAIDGNIQL